MAPGYKPYLVLREFSPFLVWPKFTLIFPINPGGREGAV